MRNLGTPTGTATGPAPLPARTQPQRPGPATRERTLLLGPVDTAPRCARATLTETLTPWGLHHLTGDAEAITSELVTNAVTASTAAALAHDTEPTPVVLTITARDGELCIRVWDPDPTPPPRPSQAPDTWAENGRGLLIVNALASRWGWHPAHGGGKYTWAALPATPPPGPQQPGQP
jgi:anti-sigma regulatory factor (Ser/Thr protein kinase)